MFCWVKRKNNCTFAPIIIRAEQFKMIELSSLYVFGNGNLRDCIFISLIIMLFETVIL